MDILISALVALLAAGIGYLAALQAAKKQITKLEEQLETANRQLDVDAVGMTSHELAAIDEVLIQYPKLRPCFYDDVEPGELGDLKDDDKERIKAIAARLVNGYATILLQSRKKLETSEQDDALFTSTAWARATVAHRYGNGPPCCDHLMTHIEEYGYTGRHQLHLMLDGLEQARIAASEQNDTKKVAQLEARIKAAKAAKDSLLKRLDESRSHHKRLDRAVVTAVETESTPAPRTLTDRS